MPFTLFPEYELRINRAGHLARAKLLPYFPLGPTSKGRFEFSARQKSPTFCPLTPMAAVYIKTYKGTKSNVHTDLGRLTAFNFPLNHTGGFPLAGTDLLPAGLTPYLLDVSKDHQSDNSAGTEDHYIYSLSFTQPYDYVLNILTANGGTPC